MGGSSIYAVRDVPGKGKGLVAIKSIPRGTRILEEQPVVTTPAHSQDHGWLQTHIEKQIESLGEQKQQAFFSLPNLHPYQNSAEQCLGILRTVGLPIDDDGIDGGVFLEACRINHACDNNAQKHWNVSTKRHTVHALRDISEGEEITIYYLGLDSSRAIRRQKLQEKFGFVCSCRLCSLPAAQSQERDQRLERIDQLDDLIGRDGMRMEFQLRTLRYVDERVRLYHEQGPGDSGLSRAYLDAAQVAIANGDLARGRVFAERAVDGWRTAYGDDSKEVAEYGSLAENPATLPLYGLSMKWKTSVDEVPEGLGATEFEDWLWRREKRTKPEPLGQPADLRNRDRFPGFTGLPKSHSDSDFYEEFNGTYQPLRYWCYLGEIVDQTIVHHLELELVDTDKKKIPLHFNTPGLGSELTPAQVKKGYTVAVPHAKRHVFLYGDPGIRLEDPSILKIFPVSLGNLMDLNDQIQQYSRTVDGTRTCHGCNKQAASLYRCGKCLLFWYCDSDCQRKGWNERGHKAACKLLKDGNLRDLLKHEGGTHS